MPSLQTSTVLSFCLSPLGPKLIKLSFGDDSIYVVKGNYEELEVKLFARKKRENDTSTNRGMARNIGKVW